MEKRTVKIGTYDTAANGWTLTGCVLNSPEMKQTYVEKFGGDGSWDLSTVLTNGVPKYKDRTLVVTLECSEGDREKREEKINEMVNQLDGMKWNIVLPDRPDHYLVGRVSIAIGYSDLAHAQVTITGTCEPWLYRERETLYSEYATPQLEVLRLRNAGRKVVIPIIAVGGTVTLTYQGKSTTLTAGTYEWAELLLSPGIHELWYTGSGQLNVVFREAVLR